MWHDILFVVLGLICLILGGNYLTDGAVAVARRFNVSSVIIGLTVVALGSSMPDIVICVESAIEQKSAIAVGDIVGANIFDILLVAGIMALIRPWRVSDTMLKDDLPMLVLASVSIWIVGDSVMFDATSTNVVTRSAGVMLLLIFIVYMRLTLRSARTQLNVSGSISAAHMPDSVSKARVVKAEGKAVRMKMLVAWISIIGGLGALVIGGNWIVDGASGIALKAGMSQSMVGLTVVAIGNSMPDMFTSVVATIKGQSSLAFGNIVGSCIINVLLALGLSAAITPLQAQGIGLIDFLTLVIGSLLLWVFPFLSKSRKINRGEGVVLTLLYVAYMTYLVLRASGGFRLPVL